MGRARTTRVPRFLLDIVNNSLFGGFLRAKNNFAMCTQKTDCIKKMRERFDEEYQKWEPFDERKPLLKDAIKPPETQKMISIIEGHCPLTQGKLNELGLGSIDEWEMEVQREIADYVANQSTLPPDFEPCWENDPLLRIFVKIHVWGGPTGRSVFVKDGGLKWPVVRSHYKRLVDVCLNPQSSQDEILEAGIIFDFRVDYVGVSFITKHIHFWTQAKRGGNALPIFDRIMAEGFGLTHSWRHVDCYWEGMQQVFDARLGTPWPTDMDSFERQLFKHFKNHPVNQKETNNKLKHNEKNKH